MDETLIREIEALRVGPDEVLVLRLPDTDAGREGMEQIAELLEAVGLAGRSIVICGDIEIAVAERPPA